MTNTGIDLNAAVTPTTLPDEKPESGFSKSDEDKLNHLADESAARATTQIKSDEASIPGDTIISNI
jgi:hypothetical protein